LNHITDSLGIQKTFATDYFIIQKDGIQRSAISARYSLKITPHKEKSSPLFLSKSREGGGDDETKQDDNLGAKH
jgi:hypothetical protein